VEGRGRELQKGGQEDDHREHSQPKQDGDSDNLHSERQRRTDIAGSPRCPNAGRYGGKSARPMVPVGPRIQPGEPGGRYSRPSPRVSRTRSSQDLVPEDPPPRLRSVHGDVLLSRIGRTEERPPTVPAVVPLFDRRIPADVAGQTGELSSTVDRHLRAY
jgi:hypothetical protein